MAIPHSGRTQTDVLADLEAMRVDDVRWREGRAFSLAYSAGPEVHALADEAYRRYSGENALNTDAFPSLRRMQADVIAIVAEWVGAGPEAVGAMTSGGTESILLAVKAARERARAERNVTRPNVVLPASAHAAFEKGCHYFGLESRRVAVGDDWRADVSSMAAAIDDETALVVGSAPQYPQGVVDPIAEIAALAAERDINCHVDACMGGVTLPYLRRLGHELPPWDMSVPGVTSISVDLHKYGYTSKGASVILHRDRRLRAHQTFVTTNWLGGLYGSAGVLGTKGGGSIAAAWAVLHHLGDDGYLRLVDTARRATERLVTVIDGQPELVVRARPDATLVAFGAHDPATLDVFAVAEELWRRGWYVDRQGPPDSLHCTVNAIHDGVIDEFAAALSGALEAVRGAGAQGSAGAYGTVD